MENHSLCKVLNYKCSNSVKRKRKVIKKSVKLSKPSKLDLYLRQFCRCQFCLTPKLATMSLSPKTIAKKCQEIEADIKKEMIKKAQLMDRMTKPLQSRDEDRTPVTTDVHFEGPNMPDTQTVWDNIVNSNQGTKRKLENQQEEEEHSDHSEEEGNEIQVLADVHPPPQEKRTRVVQSDGKSITVSLNYTDQTRIWLSTFMRSMYHLLLLIWVDQVTPRILQQLMEEAVNLAINESNVLMKKDVMIWTSYLRNMEKEMGEARWVRLSWLNFSRALLKSELSRTFICRDVHDSLWTLFSKRAPEIGSEIRRSSLFPITSTISTSSTTAHIPQTSAAVPLPTKSVTFADDTLNDELFGSASSMLHTSRAQLYTSQKIDGNLVTYKSGGVDSALYAVKLDIYPWADIEKVHRDQWWKHYSSKSLSVVVKENTELDYHIQMVKKLISRSFKNGEQGRLEEPEVKRLKSSFF